MATATAVRKLTPIQMLREIRARNKDVMKIHGEDAKRNNPLRFGARVFSDTEYLLKIIESLTGGVDEKLRGMKIKIKDEEPDNDDDDTLDADPPAALDGE